MPLILPPEDESAAKGDTKLDVLLRMTEEEQKRLASQPPRHVLEFQETQRARAEAYEERFQKAHEIAELLAQPPAEVTENYASAFHSRLSKQITDFDSTLGAEFEVGLRLASFGQSILIHLRDLSYWNPSLIIFKGETDGGAPATLIQHVSQISVLLMKLPRQNPETPKRPIGFHANFQSEAGQ